MSEESREEALRRIRRLAERLVVITNSCGLTADDVCQAVSDAYEQLSLPDKVRAADLDAKPEYGVLLGAMLSKWRSDPDYLDEMGEIKPIPRTGPAPSLHTLFEATAAELPELSSSLSEDEVVSHFLASDSVAESAPGQYIPTRSWFKISQDHSVSPLAQLNYLDQLAGSIAHNTTHVGGGKPYFVAHVPRFPVAEIPILRKMIHEDGLRFAELVDGYLTDKQLPSDSDEPSLPAGIGVYLFYEEG